METTKDQFIQQREAEAQDDHSIMMEANNWPATERQRGYLDMLLNNSVFEERQRVEIEARFEGMTVDEASKMIDYLRDNQIGVLDGSGYTQATLNSYLKRKVNNE